MTKIYPCSRLQRLTRGGSSKLCRFGAAFLLVIIPTMQGFSDQQQEFIVNKGEVDFVFAQTRDTWNAYAEEFYAPPGWTNRLTALESGTLVMTVRNDAQIGLSVQPLFDNSVDRPTFVIIGNWYAEGWLPETPNSYEGSTFKRNIDAGVAMDLGNEYGYSTSLHQRSELLFLQILIWKK